MRTEGRGSEEGRRRRRQGRKRTVRCEGRHEGKEGRWNTGGRARDAAGRGRSKHRRTERGVGQMRSIAETFRIHFPV